MINEEKLKVGDFITIKNRFIPNVLIVMLLKNKNYGKITRWDTIEFWHTKHKGNTSKHDTRFRPQYQSQRSSTYSKSKICEIFRVLVAFPVNQ